METDQLTWKVITQEVIDNLRTTPVLALTEYKKSVVMGKLKEWWFAHGGTYYLCEDEIVTHYITIDELLKIQIT